MLVLNQRDRDRLSILRQVEEGLVSAAHGARVLGLSVRQFRRLRRRFEAEGDAAVINRGRGRPSNRRIDPGIRARVLERAREPLFHDFGPMLLAEHLSRDPEIGALKAHTLRAWLIEAGLWEVKRSRPRHRKARPRRAALGELIQLDGSDHRWLEDRHPERFYLLQAVDDATNRIQIARFVPRETGAAHRQLLIDYLRAHGRPAAFYTDRFGCFGNARRHQSRTVPLEEREATQTVSIIRSALGPLGIELILALSPQAKGRVERDFGTAQDRLIKEMRLAGVSSLEEANRFLTATWIPFWNERFAVAAAEPDDAHRALQKRAPLQRLFAETAERVVSNDFTIRYDNHRFQIRKGQVGSIRAKGRITIERRLDGTTRFRSEGRYLKLDPVLQHESRRGSWTPPTGPSRANGSRPEPAPSKSTPKPPRSHSKPAPDHPWRRYPIRLDRALDRTPAAARQALPSPPSSG